MVVIAAQLPWLLVMGDWSEEDDPGVAAQPEEAEPVSSWALAEPDTAAEVAVPVPAWLAAMPAPRPRNSTALSAPATTRDRAAGWRRRRGPAAVGVGVMAVPSGGVWSGDEPARPSLGPPWRRLGVSWERDLPADPGDDPLAPRRSKATSRGAATNTEE
jgi:hypothetical protein